MKIEEAIKSLKSYPLSSNEMDSVMEEIMTGKIATPLIISFLTALNEQGIDSEELVGAARVMRRHMVTIEKSRHRVVLDTCGTGGDRKHTFNISTAAAFVASGAGIAVAKHGNRSVSSMCGSADVLEALGVNINMKPEVAQRCLDEAGITFLFAPNFHPAMKYAMEARKEIAKKGEKTIFNFLGPLCNPASATHQLVGTYNSGLAKVIADSLKELGTQHALVICGRDNLDEITTRVNAGTQVYEVRQGKMEEPKGKDIDASDFGFKTISPGSIKGGTAKDNAEILLNVLNGQKGPYRDIVLLNAGAAIYVADRAKSIKDGIALAEDSIDTGESLKKLELLKEYSNK